MNDILFELIIFVEVAFPFTTDIKSLENEIRSF